MSGDETTVEAQRLGDNLRMIREAKDKFAAFGKFITPERIEWLFGMFNKLKSGMSSDAVKDFLGKFRGMLPDDSFLATVIDGALKFVNEIGTLSLAELPTEADAEAIIAEMQSEPTAQAFDPAAMLMLLKLLVGAWRFFAGEKS